MVEGEPILGYCTNVHAGIDVDAILGNLRTHALAVRRHLQRAELPVGLWFSQNAASQALCGDTADRIARELKDMGLVAYTFNGFPQGDFHSAVVKHRVYLPPWWDPSRLAYTRDLVRLLDQLLAPSCHGSISTLPIAWGDPAPSREQWRLAASQLVALADQLHQLAQTTGRHIVVALEPEPGCAITDTASLRRFFVDHLSEQSLGHAQADRVRSHVTMCHDICHAAVMAEDQQTELLACRDEGVRIGKIQVSSAIRVRWDDLDAPMQREAIDQLAQFAEDRYLHQTMICSADGGRQLAEDLPKVLEHVRHSHQPHLQGEWRIHFHVPIDIASWGTIESTQNEIDRFLQLVRREPALLGRAPHLEVETYAWGVLPTSLRTAQLHEGIARELAWLQPRLQAAFPTRGVDEHG